MIVLLLSLLRGAVASEPAASDAPTPATGSEVPGSAALAPVRPQPFTGSYGRVQASSDLRGGRGSGAQVATWGPRLQLGPYLELDVGWDATLDDGTELTVLVTPGVSGDVFHYTGNFDAIIGMRNLYAELRNISGGPFSAWAGSRMYRGDDIYLLDFWPLDNLNTYGGGGAVDVGRSRLAVQAGVNRLTREAWQVQEAPVARPGAVAGEQVLVLDRQRAVGSLLAEHRVPIGDLTLRFKGYGELHALPAGTRLVDDGGGQRVAQDLPNDRGVLLGAQVSVWGWGTQSFAHLWVRHATGLAAVGELTVPTSGFDLDLRVARSRRSILAVTGNTEHGWFGVMWAGYVQSITDADGIEIDFDDRVEAVGAIRPNLWIGRHGAMSLELSQQYVRPNGLNPRTARYDRGSVTQISVIPALQAAPGAYTRPRVHLLYTLSLLNDGALAFRNPADVRAQSGTQHYFGLGAEWWLNSRRVIVPE
jgi:hypothetical protein